jgi:hypothetical protein
VRFDLNPAHHYTSTGIGLTARGRGFHNRAMAAPSWFVFALIPLVLWRIYARIRRNIGRQRSRAWRHWCGVVLFPLVALMLAMAASSSALAEAALWCGFLGGAVLALRALRLTRFERTVEGFFFTPNAYIGVALSLLLVSRVLYRLAQVYGVGGVAKGTHTDFAAAPLTLLILGLVAGYYSAYGAGLLRWRRRAEPLVP